MGKDTAKIECCNCGNKRKDYGYGLCFKCYKKFTDGEIQHPQGFYIVKPSSCKGMSPVITKISPDSDASTLTDHNPLDLPFWVEEQPADPTCDPFAWWEYAA